MSMLSAQCDELRAMAESVGLAMPQAATLMMEAADTIWELREQNHYLMKGDLLHVLTDQEYIDQCERERLMQVSIDALDKENAELREVLKLAAFVLETIEHVTSWRFEGDGKVFDSTYFYDYLRELGVTE